MDRKRRLALIFATVGIALGAGHIVQNGSGGGASVATATRVPTAVTPVSAGPVKTAPVVATQTASSMTGQLTLPRDVPIITAALTDPVTPFVKPKPVPEPEPVADACAVGLDLLAEENAMIGIMLNAPCAPATRVVLRHAGLTVTAKTSVTGALFMSLPAMDKVGKVAVTVRGQTPVEKAIPIPEMADVRRFGVQWQNADAFQVHAFENGAAFGGLGHVSAAVPQTPHGDSLSTAGYLTLLGDATMDLPMLAEIYTFPATGTPDVVVEAAITTKTCGRELLGETLTSTKGAVTVVDLTLATPDCTAIGDILVLNNLVADPTMVAAN